MKCSLASAATLTALCGVLAACSGEASHGPGTLSQMPGSGIAALTTATLKSTSVHYTGTVNDATVDVTTDIPGQGCRAAVSQAGSTYTVEIIRDGLYFNANTTFWTQWTGQPAAELPKPDQWVHTPKSDALFVPLLDVCDPSAMLAGNATGITKSGPTTWRGHRVFVLNAAGDHAYVTDTATPRLLYLTGTTNAVTSGSLTFDYDTTTPVRPPRADHVVNSSTYGW